MAAFKSTQETKRTAVPAQMLSANEYAGHVRIFYFDYTTPTGGVAVSDTIDLVTLPAGRIIGGKVAFDAMSSGGGTAKLRIGTTSDDAHLLASTSVDVAGVADIGHTLALNYGEVLTGNTLIQAVNPNDTSEAWAAAKKISGHILLAQD